MEYLMIFCLCMVVIVASFLAGCYYKSKVLEAKDQLKTPAVKAVEKL